LDTVQKRRQHNVWNMLRIIQNNNLQVVVPTQDVFDCLSRVWFRTKGEPRNTIQFVMLMDKSSNKRGLTYPGHAIDEHRFSIG